MQLATIILGEIVMLKSVQRKQRLMASTVATALMLAVSAIGPLSGNTAFAAVQGSNDAVYLACNNTFAPIKFPLEYDVIAQPSANPIAPGSTFTVDFDVTVKAAAGFLNGVYAALVGAGQALSDIPITQDVATIIPLTGATGPAVSAKLAATFTIPKPAVTPVTADVSIPLGHVTGTYTADASGEVSFAFRGNAYMPAQPAVVGPPAVAARTADPTGLATPVYGWINAKTAPPTPAKLTPSGLETYTKVSLVNGLVTPYLVCMGGTWTPTPATTPGANPTFDFPLRCPVGFAKFAISGDPQINDPTPPTTVPVYPVPNCVANAGDPTPPTTVPVTTVPGTTVPGTVPATTVPGTVPATTAPATTTPSATTAPATTAPATTSPPTTAPATTVPAALVTNTATYVSDCTNNVTPDHSTLTYEVTASAKSPVSAGDTITISNQTWTVTVPGALATTLKPLLPNGLTATSIGTFTATNADPGEIDTEPLTGNTPWPDPIGPIVTVIHPADVSFTATGGDVTIGLSGTFTTVDLPSLFITAELTCVMAADSPALLTLKSRDNSPGTTAPATTTPGGGGGVTTTSVVASEGQIPRTGSSSSVLWVELFGGLLIIQLGMMMWSTGQGRRRRRVL